MNSFLSSSPFLSGGNDEHIEEDNVKQQKIIQLQGLTLNTKFISFTQNLKYMNDIHYSRIELGIRLD